MKFVLFVLGLIAPVHSAGPMMVFMRQLLPKAELKSQSTGHSLRPVMKKQNRWKPPVGVDGINIKPMAICIQDREIATGIRPLLMALGQMLR